MDSPQATRAFSITRLAMGSTFDSYIGRMKIFISMGMKSKSTEQVRSEMSAVFEKIKNKLPEAELLDSIIDGADKSIAIKGDDIGMWYLAKSIEIMSEADIVFFIDDYDKYRGCSVEKLVAESYGKLCVEFKT